MIFNLGIFLKSVLLFKSCSTILQFWNFTKFKCTIWCCYFAFKENFWHFTNSKCKYKLGYVFNGYKYVCLWVWRHQIYVFVFQGFVRVLLTWPTPQKMSLTRKGQLLFFLKCFVFSLSTLFWQLKVKRIKLLPISFGKYWHQSWLK